ncbi:MAG: hypothetical protein JO184_03680 [Gammaproteobacteria bacterium]|nr:hypothetical protein [Gammaproteobacteria bacterium]MBV8306795.1 hypothetical protein [Gammaproteobacteria bacterium]MBV8405653.1 hypothetical protein [Gammaproteobacteria bacterium]
MQAVESQKLILYQTDLRGQWPQGAARSFLAALPYARRLALRSARAASSASLAGVALALRALGDLLGRRVAAGELRFPAGEKPRLVRLGPAAADHTVDFSISHTGPWVACAALSGGRVGLDLEMGTDARILDWVVREATLKASGDGLRALREARALGVHAGQLSWRGVAWRVRQLEGFAGASACLVCDRDLAAIVTREVALAELFDS